MNRNEFEDILARRGTDPAAANVARSIFGQESSYGAADTSKPNKAGALGPMQVIEPTFNGLKNQGLIPKEYEWNNPQHSTEAGVSLIEDLWNRYQDPPKVAAVYFGGPRALDRNGNIQSHLQDITGKSIGSYASDVVGRLTGISSAQAEPAQAPTTSPSMQYAQWLIANKASRGSPEFNQVVDSYHAALQNEGLTQYLPQQQQQEPTEYAGFTGAFKSAMPNVAASIAAGRYAASGTTENAKALVDASASKYKQMELGDIGGISDFLEYGKELAGGALGFMAAPTAAAFGTELATRNPVAAGYAATGIIGSQLATQDLARQAQQHLAAQEKGQAYEPSVARAAIATAAQLALFEGALSKFPFVSKLLGHEGEEVAAKTGAQLKDALDNKTLTYANGLMEGIGKGVKFQVPVMMGQQALERWQAGMPLLDADARKEYMNAAASGAAMGVGFGGYEGFKNTATDRGMANQYQKEQDLIKDLTAKETAKAAAVPAAPTAGKPVASVVEAPPGVITPSDVRVAGAPAPVVAEGETPPVVPPLKIEDILSKWNEVPAPVAAEVPAVAPAVAPVVAKVAPKKAEPKKAEPLVLTSEDKARVLEAFRTIKDPTLKKIAATGIDPKIVNLAKNALLDEKLLSKDGPFKWVVTPAEGVKVDEQVAATKPNAPAVGESVAGSVPTAIAKGRAADETVTGGVGVPSANVGELPAGEKALNPALKAKVTKLEEDHKTAEAFKNAGIDESESEATVQEGVSLGRIVNDLRESAVGIYTKKLISKEDYNLIRAALSKSIPDIAFVESKLTHALEQQELKHKLVVSESTAAKKIGDAKVATEIKANVAHAKELGEKVKVKVKKRREIAKEEPSTPDEEALAAAAAIDARKKELEAIPDEDEVVRELPLLQRGEVTNTGVKTEEAKKAVDEATSGWTNKPKIKVVDSVKDLPHEVRSDVHHDAKGVYDPNTHTIHIIAGNAKDASGIKATLFHEALGHFGLSKKFRDKLDSVLEDILKHNSGVKVAVEEWKKRFPDSYTHLTGHERDIRAVEEVLAGRSETGPIKHVGLRGALNKIIAVIRDFGRQMGLVKDWTDNDVTNLLHQAHETVIHGGEAENIRGGIRMQRTEKAAPAEDRTPEELLKSIGKGRQQYEDRPSLVEKLKNFVKSGHKNYEEIIRLTQNERRPLKVLEDYLARSNLIRRGDGDFNNAYEILSQAAGESDRKLQVLNPHLDKLNKSIVDIAKRDEITPVEVLKRLQAYSIAMHEGERRLIKFLKNVPLNNKIHLNVGGIKMTPAQYREEIFKALHQNIDLVKGGETKQMRKILEDLVDKYKVADGWSRMNPTGTMKGEVLSIDSPIYDVAGSFSKAELQTLRKMKDAAFAGANGADLKNIFDAVKDIQKETIRLDSEANYWSTPVNNITDFYGYEHYMPFKGRPGSMVSKEDQELELGDKHTSGEFSQYAEEAGGRKSDSDNPVLQTMADAGKAAGRAGNSGYTEAIKNLITQKHLAGKLVEKIPFEDRYNGVTKKDIQGKNNIFHYMPDGSIEVYKISNEKMANAVRGYAGQNIFQSINKFTGFIGKGHTRLNVAFSPYNLTRHLMTTAWTIGGDLSPKESARFLAYATNEIAARNGVAKALKAAVLYSKNDFKTLESLANAGDPAYRNLKEFIEIGGRTSYIRSLGSNSHIEDLIKQVGKSGVATKVDHVHKWFDLWADGFDLAGRAATYGFMKDKVLSRLEKEGRDIKSPEVLKEAQIEAAAYAKNMFNFEQVGKYGREIGSWVMFFRPTITTAVRALDVLLPAFRSGESMLAHAPDTIKGKNEDGTYINQKAVDAFLADHKMRQTNARTMMLAMAGLGMTAYGAAYMMSPLDEEGRNRVGTDDMAMWTRNIRLPLGEIGEKLGVPYLVIPTGFGLGAFIALGAQVGGLLAGNNSIGKIVGNMIPIAMDSYLPLPVAKFNPMDNPIAWIAESAAPSFARPFIEYGMNIDSFGRQVHSSHQNAWGDAYVSSEHIPDFYSNVTRFMANATTGDVTMSPDTLHFFLNAYLDGQSRIIHNSWDLGMVLTGMKDFDIKRDTFVLDSFIGKYSSVDNREFAEIEKGIKKTEAILNMFKGTDKYDDYIDAHPNAEMVVNMYNKNVNGGIKNIRGQMNKIRANTEYSPKERKEALDDLGYNLHALERSFIDAYQDYQKD
ncbi:MAG: LPD38 domain-containing protein [bacterium]